LDDYNHRFIAKNLRYLRSNRIELGAITAAAGPQRSWEWLKDKILKKFPNRDYTRVFDVPEAVMPKAYLLLRLSCSF
jgi:hypothetical protein